ncbi:hypothetical protein J5868_01965 [Candidatus Saccharibacteria bacterium]|nr:hypothetical protein [Candidatus Saccharibacteria bacterium]
MGGKLIEVHLYKVEKKEKTSRDLGEDIMSLFNAPQTISTKEVKYLGWFYGVVDEKGDFLCRENKWRRRKTRYLFGKIYDDKIIFKLFDRRLFSKHEELITIPAIGEKDAYSSSGARYEIAITTRESALDQERYKEYGDSLVEDVKILPKWRREQMFKDGTSFCDVAREVQKSEDAKARTEAMGKESFEAEAAGRR